MGFILQGVKEEFNASVFELGIIISFYPLGLLTGAIIFGLISDRFGRMQSYKKTVIIASISGTLLLTSVNVYMVGVFLFLTGAGMGGDFFLSPIIFGEFSPPSKRYLISLLSLFWGLGATLAAFTAFMVSLFNTTQFSD